MMAVVPEAFVTKLAAAKVLLIVLVPLLFKFTAPRAAAPVPTAPVKVTPPLPLVTVKACAVVSLTVFTKVTKLLVVVNTASAPKVTASL